MDVNKIFTTISTTNIFSDGEGKHTLRELLNYNIDENLYVYTQMQLGIHKIHSMWNKVCKTLNIFPCTMCDMKTLFLAPATTRGKIRSDDQTTMIFLLCAYNKHIPINSVQMLYYFVSSGWSAWSKRLQIVDNCLSWEWVLLAIWYMVSRCFPTLCSKSWLRTAYSWETSERKNAVLQENVL